MCSEVPRVQTATDGERAAGFRRRLPHGGLFAGHDWRWAPRPFRLAPDTMARIERLGGLFHAFNRACNRLYLASAEGAMPGWIAAWLDAGKPAELVAFARDKALRKALPAVIRPDLLLMEDGGLRVTELDSVPGGIGATAWMQEEYAGLGEAVAGGPRGMRGGWENLLPEGDVLISKEAATYRPEMEWLNAGRAGVEVVAAEGYAWRDRPVYRFFEAFDLSNLPRHREWMDAVLAGGRMTPPLKPYLEEKMWLALFWVRPLQGWWRTELGEKGQRLLREIIPFGWVLHPETLPPHAVHPRLEIQDWNEMAHFSQKQRRLVVKVSGFSPEAWGSRGVWFGHDLAAGEWASVVREALEAFPRSPRIMQEFEHAAAVPVDWFDEAAGVTRATACRVRLCPYYFVEGDAARLGGVLVTAAPADKKAVHGMRDAVLTVAAKPE